MLKYLRYFGRTEELENEGVSFLVLFLEFYADHAPQRLKGDDTINGRWYQNTEQDENPDATKGTE
jgi:hypothetical protein